MKNIEQVVAEVLELEPGDVDDDTGHATHPAWTSLAHLEVVMVVEETYQVKLTSAELQNATSVTALRRVLGEKGVVA